MDSIIIERRKKDKENKFIDYTGKIKETKQAIDDTIDFIDDGIEKAKKSMDLMQQGLKKSKKLQSMINNKASVKVGKTAENIVNFTGHLIGKDLKKYAGAAKQLGKAGTQKFLLGTISPKQTERFKNNMIAKKVLDKVDIKKLGSGYEKIKDGIDKAFSFTLDDVIQKSNSLVGKGMKKIDNAKITGIMKKAADSKILGAVKDIGNKKFVKSFTKAFSPVGTAMNVHTMMTDKSDFKRVLAGVDVAGDFTPLAPITSAVSLAGEAVYDFFDSDFMERFGGKKVTKVLDKGAGFIVKPVAKAIKSTQKAWGFMKNTASAVKEHGLLNTLKSGMNLVKKKTPEPIKKALKGYANMYLHPIQTAQKAGAFLADKSKDIFKKSNPNDFNDIYYRNFALANNRQPQIQHNGQLMQNRLQGSQTVSPSQNTFTININGTNKSTQEIMNEMVPEIKLRMKNISIA